MYREQIWNMKQACRKTKGWKPGVEKERERLREKQGETDGKREGICVIHYMLYSFFIIINILYGIYFFIFFLFIFHLSRWILGNNSFCNMNPLLMTDVFFSNFLLSWNFFSISGFYYTSSNYWSALYCFVPFSII